jgi:hypothetical protein
MECHLATAVAKWNGSQMVGGLPVRYHANSLPGSELAFYFATHYFLREKGKNGPQGKINRQ